MKRRTLLLLLAALLPAAVPAQPAADLTNGRFAWTATAPLLGPDRSGANPEVALKDPTIVRHDGRWHLFATLRRQTGHVDMVYLNFADWADAAAAPRHVLNLHDQYNCAPQVFYFTPHRCWYLVYQMADKDRTPPFGPVYSTSTNLADPRSWSAPRPLMKNPPAKPKWIDFWVICDAAQAHLFYTSNDGRMWHSATPRADFPGGTWSAPDLALQGDIFEASHTYALKGRSDYLTLIEAQGGGRRYYKAYLADRLAGPWRPLAASMEQPFAGAANVRQETPWTDSISHGELVRTGADEFLEVDPARLQFIFQGASDAEYRNKPYGQIPWRLGRLDAAPSP